MTSSVDKDSGFSFNGERFEIDDSQLFDITTRKQIFDENGDVGITKYLEKHISEFDVLTKSQTAAIVYFRKEKRFARILSAGTLDMNVYWKKDKDICMSAMKKIGVVVAQYGPHILINAKGKPVEYGKKTKISLRNRKRVLIDDKDKSESKAGKTNDSACKNVENEIAPNVCPVCFTEYSANGSCWCTVSDMVIE